MKIKKIKIKRFAIERIPVEVEYIRPIAGRLFLLFHFHRLIKYAKVHPAIWDVPVCKPIYRLYIPKIIATKGGDTL